MYHRDILAIFTDMFFHQYGREVVGCVPHGKNTIRIRLKSGKELIFSYFGEDDWKLQTIANYSRRPAKIRGVVNANDEK